MTKKDIKNKIKELEDNLKQLNPSKDERLISFKKLYNELYDEIYKELEPKREKIQKEIDSLQNQLKSKVKIRLEVPEELENWLKSISRGFENSNNWKLVWYSDNLKYVILSQPGHLGWAGIGLSQHYYPSEYKLMKVIEEVNHRSYYDDCIYSVEGRLTKDKFQEILDTLPENSRKGVKV